MSIKDNHNKAQGQAEVGDTYEICIELWSNEIAI